MPGASPSSLLATFNEHDADNSNTMALSELREALSELKVSVSEERLSKIVKEYDTDSSGELSFSEFSAIFDTARLRAVFDGIDKDGSGEIGAEELRGAMESLGHKLGAGQIKSILKKVSTRLPGCCRFVCSSLALLHLLLSFSLSDSSPSSSSPF